MTSKPRYSMLKNGSGVKITGGDVQEIVEALYKLADVEVLVGFPEDTTERKNDTGETLDGGAALLKGKSAITNAALGYIHDNGAPEQNITARPFMTPGIKDVQQKITDKLMMTAKAVLKGKGMQAVEMGMTQVGLTAQLGIQNKITEGIPPPLSDYTLKQRARKGRKGAGLELVSRSMGYAPSMDFAKPLVDTGQLRKAVTYVIRSRKKRK